MRMLTIVLLAGSLASGEVYSPKVLRKGQPDASDLARLAQGIYAEAGATTPRDRAEAIWRFFLTDGRFVKPGFWYHIAGWAYEEPGGEVLDAVKLLNSYGFGLCYHIAPVLEAVWKAGGFEDARVWFLTGHTVAEVFYDGGYHYFDSDMMGYNTAAGGRVASVHEIENDGGIILAQKNPSSPWYPADVRAGAMRGLAELFTTRQDNWLFPLERAAHAHTMDFVLRPGEKLIRYFRPERDDLFYLPYEDTGDGWQEFPRGIAQYKIRTADGPRSQKDARLWATGRIEYSPAPASGPTQIVEVRSPYVIIDAEFRMDAVLASPSDSVTFETSCDEGRTWTAATALRGGHLGEYRAEPAVVTRSEHGRRTAVSGRYAYLVRLTRTGGARIDDIRIVTRFELNPRTLPALANGRNEILYSSGPPIVRREFEAGEPLRVSNAKYVSGGGQGFWTAAGPGFAELVFRVSCASPAEALAMGGRLLDLSHGLAPDKFTAEVRRVPAIAAHAPAASIAWSTAAAGPFETVWEYDPRVRWRDGMAIDRTLLWPEVDRRVAVHQARELFVRYRFRDLALDSVRMAAETSATGVAQPLEITHVWKEDGVEKRSTRTIDAGAKTASYSVDSAPNARIENGAVIFECRR